MKTHPFQDIFLVVTKLHEQCDLPAGVAVDSIDLQREAQKSNTTRKLELEPTFMAYSPHLFAAQVVQKLDVTGMKRLPCVHWHQHHLVSNYHLHPKHQTVTKTNTRLYGRQAVFKATGVHA